MVSNRIVQLAQLLGTPEQIARIEAEGGQVNAPLNDKAVEYLARLKMEAPQPRLAVRQYQQTESFTPAFDRFRKIWLQRAIEVCQVEQKEKHGIEYSDAQKQTIAELVKYFINDRSCSFPLNKGVYLYGNPGTGKSELMHIFSVFAEINKPFKIWNLAFEISIAKDDKDYQIVNTLSQGDACLDEVGFNDEPLVRFGEKVKVLDTIIYNRHLKYTRSGLITHIVSNLQPSEWQTIGLDPRNIDRLRQMLTPIPFVGKSFR
jgi:hypothetical protein